MNVKINRIKNKSEECQLKYSINGSSRSIVSDQKLTPAFEKSLKELVPVALRIAEIKDKPENYEFVGLSIQRKETEEGENRSCVISIKKALAVGTLNISTPKRWLECDKEDAGLLDDISQAAIREACSNAADFIRNDGINLELYSQAELTLNTDEAREPAAVST